MSPLTTYVAKLLGLYCLLVGIAMLLNKSLMFAMVAAFPNDPTAIVLTGVFALAIGLAIVVGHNVWSGGVLPVLVTVVGWAATLKGLAFLLIPLGAEPAYLAAFHYGELYFVYDGITLVLGAYMTYAGFRRT